MDTFRYGHDRLTSSIALSIARGNSIGIIIPEVQAKIEKSALNVQKIASGSRAVYGINTGFGPLCTTQITPKQTLELQYNLLRSHAVGMGAPIDPLLAKLMLILKVHALCQGVSGVQLATIARIIWHIDNDIIPRVPEQGSVGASGDLAPLSHLFLPLIGEGELYHEGTEYDCNDILSKYDMQPLTLGPKEGIGLINGTQFIAAHAVMVVEKLFHLCQTADISGALSLESFKGSLSPFRAALHQTRPFKGNIFVAKHINKLVEGSTIIPSHENCERVQDPYSMRCIPQVHGASRTAWAHLRDLVEIEINSVTDNPIVFSDTDTVSGGNFHGQPLAMVLDYAAIAAAELGSISERRSYLLLEGKVSGVPKLLMQDVGTKSGFMIPQYAAAAIVSENKVLCHPASVDTIPTSLGQEDHVSMGSISGRKALKVCENVEKILAIELMYSCQAYDYLSPLQSGPALHAIYQEVRNHIPHTESDVPFYQWQEKLKQLVSSGKLSLLSPASTTLQSEDTFIEMTSY